MPTAGFNEQLAGLGVRAKALRADPSCSSPVAEVQWGDLYPRIVIQTDRPGVTITPGAIPVNQTLVLAAERAPRPGRQPLIVVRTLLVKGEAPTCVGVFLRPRSPLARFSARAREVVAGARQQAGELQDLNVGPEHVLLALVSDPDSSVVHMLRDGGDDPEQIRASVTGLLNRADPDGDPTDR